ncbi:GTPase HflX-like [Zingiber officinale]|uniref:GTPase HflX-like n=1 Tax=Zingiber officinale TaxID=94328 RepID=UPI001C4C63B3|nr:GTPase HflX-like [Zingiber officinale]
MSFCCSCIVPHRAATASASPSIASSPRRSLHHQSHYPFRRRVPFVRLSSTLWRCRTRPIGVLKEANEVDANVSEGDPSPEGGFREDATDGLVANGVAGEASEGSLDLVIRDAVRSRRKADEDEQEYDRYTMRNGREVFQEKAYLVGVECKGSEANIFSIEESLKELAQLADTAGLWVVDSTYQKLANPNPRTYIGSGKVAEIKSAIHALDVETVIFDDELSAGQLRNLEKALGGDVRVCDRTALILDIFNQRAATHEAALQVSLAQMEYQLPRLTKMWSHLERQAGGKVKGMGEKQIEVDKRILRTQISALRKELESVRQHRKQYRNRRLSVPVPVVSLVGYTNAGKSTLLNRLTGADVLAEDQLFATLDPTTRRVQMRNGKEFLLTDTVGFIQKLPTMLVAAFRATLEEISESSLIVHVVDISHPLANQQIDAVNKVLQELDVALIPKLIVWNKIDKTSGPDTLKSEAEKIGAVCISAINGDGLEQFCSAVQAKLKDSLVPVEALIPYEKGELLNSIHQVGLVERTEYKENGTLVIAHVPLPLARLLTPMRQLTAAQ